MPLADWLTAIRTWHSLLLFESSATVHWLKILYRSFFKAYTRLDTYKKESKFSTWLYRIVTNEALKKIKKKQFSGEVQVSDLTDEEAFDWNEALQVLKEEEQKRFIAQTLDAMSRREALVLQLYYLDEQEMSEIGQILDLKPEHVKVILSRARKQFYTIFSQQLKLELHTVL